MSRRALLVIDMVNDFVAPEGALYVGSSVQGVIERISQEIAAFRQSGERVIYIADTHRKDDEEFQMFRPHCLAETSGSKIYPALQPQKGDLIIPKRRYSAFYGTDLDLTLREQGISELVLVGVCTNICVLYTAADARMRGYSVSVIKEGVTSFDQEAHAFALKEMGSVLGVKLC